MLRLVRKINTETGEVYSEEKKFYEDVLTDDGYKVPVHKAGAKIFGDVVFPKEMTDSEIGKMTRLAKLMISTSNMLGYRTKGSILPYTEKHLINVVGLSPKRGKQFVQKMVDLGMIQRIVRQYGEVESIEFYINPVYFFAGKRIGLNLYLLFREHLDLILPKWVRSEFLRMAASFSEKAK